MKIAAFDLSLTRPAVCFNGDLDVVTPDSKGHERLAYIWTWVATWVDRADLVAIEGYAYARPNQAHQIGELGGVIRHNLWTHGIPYLDVPPSNVKKYATGKGNASKDDVVDAAYRRGGDLYQGSSNDEADAFWIWALASELAGQPVVEVPAKHREALAKLELPGQVAA